MNLATQVPTVLIVLGVLAVVGLLAAFTSGRRAARQAVKGVREVSRMTGMAFRTLVTTAVITGVQWAIVTNAHDTRVIVITLAVPALFAGASVARLLAVTEVVHSARRGGHYR
ncbi:MAG: hypothetical protein ACJ72N_21060 [Labedaea sp.]